MTTILDLATDAERGSGTKIFTPRWEACMRAFYGLEIRPEDAVLLAASTRRDPASWIAENQSANRHQRRELWARVGRRGRKSFTMAFVAIFEALYGGHERYLVPGEQGLIAIISKDVAGSNLVARFCQLHAEALGIATNWTSIGSVRVLELTGIPFGIACFACNAKAPRGFAVPVVILDEPAHWATDEGFLNSDDDVLSAIKPAMAQFPDAKLMGISTPLAKVGLHHEMVEANLGENADPKVLAVEGPTWEWNPDISEARTHELEKDTDLHLREYGAKPRDSRTAALPGPAISAAQRYLPAGLRMMTPVVCVDFSSGRGDGCVWARVCWAHQDDVPEVLSERRYLPGFGHYWEPVTNDAGETTPNPEYKPTPPLLVVGPLQHQLGKFWQSLPSSDLVARMVRDAKSWGLPPGGIFIGDQAQNYALEPLFAQHGYRFISVAWTQPNKVAAVLRIKRWLRDGQLCLPMPTEGPAAARLDVEARAYEERVLPSGALTYAAPGNGHDDHVAAALMTPAIADSLNLLPHSPTAPRSRRDMNSIREFLGDGS
ncbi:MAG TPA: hypothetical protein VHP33_28090 [Polyangiaceae bacterium]|nr:hypothetical protein [Polyangiaceae bacterium]